MVTRTNWVAAGVAAAMTIHALSATAQAGSGASTMERWSAEAQKQLQRALTEPRPIGRPSEGLGVVDVVFTIDATGRPASVAVLHPSGRPAFDHLALNAVRRIHTRSSLPAALSQGQQAVARIFSVPGDRAFAKQEMGKLVVETAARQGWAAIDRLAGAQQAVRLAVVQ